MQKKLMNIVLWFFSPLYMNYTGLTQHAECYPSGPGCIHAFIVFLAAQYCIEFIKTENP